MADSEPQGGRRRVEILVVVLAVGGLIALAVPLLAELRGEQRPLCADRLRRLGQWLVIESVRTGRYPVGGVEPGVWDETRRVAVGALGSAQALRCPDIEDGSSVDPMGWASCSYAYLGALSDPAALYWAGLEYDADQPGPIQMLRDLSLSDSLVRRAQGADGATLPGSAAFQSGELRQVPQVRDDNAAPVPLVMDIAVLKALPPDAKRWEDAHLYVSDANKRTLLYANHCNTSAREKRWWGINVFYTDGSVRWRDWHQLRLQCAVRGADVGSAVEDHYYFY